MQNTPPKTLGRRELLKGTALLAVAATARAQGEVSVCVVAGSLARGS